MQIRIYTTSDPGEAYSMPTMCIPFRCISEPLSDKKKQIRCVWVTHGSSHMSQCARNSGIKASRARTPVKNSTRNGTAFKNQPFSVATSATTGPYVR